MQPRHQVSRTAIELITRFEGYRGKAARLPDGRWTIGYGHTQTAREGAEVSEKDAEALLLYDLIGVAHVVNENTYAPLNQNQFDALCAFAFNIGVDPFRRSAVLRLINEGQLLQAACAMELWRKAWFEGELIVIDALVRRRAAEKTLFLTPTDGFVAAPSAILPPKIDADGLGLVPRQTPVVVRAHLEGEAAVAEREGPSPSAFVDIEKENEPGPARAAAAALAVRLQTIFPDDAEGGAEPSLADDAVPEEAAPAVAAFPLAELGDVAQGPVDAPPAPAVEAEADTAVPPAPVADERDVEAEAPEPQVEAETAPDNVRPFPLTPAEPALDEADDHVADDVPFAPAMLRPEPKPARWRIGAPWLLLGALFGVALFAWGLFWVFNSQSASGPGGVDPMVLGWPAGIAGVGFFGVAAYMLLDRLGRADDEIDGEGDI